MDQRRIQIIGLQLRNRQNPCLIHNDGITFRMTAAGSISHDAGIKFLIGSISGYRTGDYIRAGAFAV